MVGREAPKGPTVPTEGRCEGCGKGRKVKISVKIEETIGKKIKKSEILHENLDT